MAKKYYELCSGFRQGRSRGEAERACPVKQNRAFTELPIIRDSGILTFFASSVIIKIMMKKCPFNQDECNSECALFIAPKELNELVENRLHSIGVFDRVNGMCAFKNLALGESRYIFEKSSTNSF